MEEQQQHYLLVSCPAQGHMNPTLQLAKRLLRTGAHVTFATSIHGHRRMLASAPPPPPNLSYASYSDGYDDGAAASSSSTDPSATMDRIRRVGSQSLSDLLRSLANLRTPPVTCLIYAVLLPWAAEVAREHRIPSALLWIQPSSVFALCHHYFQGHVSPQQQQQDPSIPIKLPGMPLLSRDDLPTFFHVDSPHAFVLSTFKDHFMRLQEEGTTKASVLVNSFDSIEGDAIRAVDEYYDVFAIGPLVPLEERSYGCDLISDLADRVDYVEWLSSKPESSVVYVSFGSMVELPRRQMAEILRGLVESRRPFLWALRSSSSLEDYGFDLDSGLVVEWCAQVEVLSHKSVGCFVSHCGWNSTLESMACGVPIVACPHWSDQTTIAKMVDEVWKCGVRANSKRVISEQQQQQQLQEESQLHEERVVGSEELQRCLEMVMGLGERGEEMRKNAHKLRDLAKEAMNDDKGSSCSKGVQAFVEKIKLSTNT